MPQSGNGVHLPLMTTSRLKAARACLRLHKLTYLEGYRPVETAEALRFGSLVHAGLEAWWGSGAPGAGIDPPEAYEAVLRTLAAKEADPFERAKAEEMLKGYSLRWGDEPYDVLGVEVPFEVPLINPATGAASRTWRLAGKIDAIVRDRRDGRVLIVEHKTAASDISPGSDYWRRLRLDSQISIYYEGARALGYDVAGCLYDVLGKPSIRPLKATPMESRKYKANGSLYANQRDQDETADQYRQRLVETIAAEPAEYFARGEVARLEAELTEAMHDVWQTSRQIREAELAGHHPRNVDACDRWGRVCEFLAVCSGEASVDDPHLFTKSAVVHPELAVSKPEIDSDGRKDNAA